MEKTRTELLQKCVDPSTDLSLINDALRILNGVPCKPNGVKEKFLSDMEAREYSGNISRTTLWKWRKQGLKAYGVGSRVLYLPSELDKFIKAGGRA